MVISQHILAPGCICPSGNVDLARQVELHQVPTEPSTLNTPHSNLELLDIACTSIMLDLSSWTSA